MSAPVRLFLVSPALAVRSALARALDAEAEIEVVGEASTSSDALARVPAVRPDVVLAGSRLRDPDAVELCRLLRQAMPGLHVLVLDVDEDQKLVASAISAGASGLVPDDERDLVDAIETAAALRHHCLLVSGACALGGRPRLFSSPSLYGRSRLRSRRASPEFDELSPIPVTGVIRAVRGRCRWEAPRFVRAQARTTTRRPANLWPAPLLGGVTPRSRG